MTNRRADIIANLDKNLEDSIGLFKSLKSKELNFQLYQDGACWTVKQVLAHFITIERSMHWLFNNILSGGPGSPEDFDFERFNRTQPKKLDALNIDDLIRKFRSVRQETISMVKGMSEDDLDREGLHAFHGHGKLERFIRWAYEHVQIHENDIRMKLQIVNRRPIRNLRSVTHSTLDFVFPVIITELKTAKRTIQVFCIIMALTG